jgi:hypothetical protein
MTKLCLTAQVNWNQYPSVFKRGAYVQRRTVVSAFTTEEIDALPPKHAARSNPDLQVERHVCSVLELPPLAKIANREAVIFDGADPVLAQVTAPEALAV